MLPLLKQQELMNELYGAVISSVDGDFDRVECEFLYEEVDDGGYSVGTSFHYELDGQIFHRPLSGESLGEISAIIPELHQLMKEAGMGDWYKCTMSFLKGGSVSLKYQHKEADKA
ncbi:hypothetical protein CPA56_09130 [Bombella sp. TMW2.1889]|uniref:DUF600 family protein n=2 Tax=Bombella mellum TaxID=2039288 RepID=A0ABR5ZUZ2_9PROT|nr:hypothetical protein [Bombella mellum]